jgi:hypothetical protein
LLRAFLKNTIPGQNVNGGLAMRSKGSGFKAFLRRHDRLLTYLGALIVFFTFIIKEGLGDSWQHVSEAIDTATYFYSLNAKVSDAEDSLSALVSDLKTGPLGGVKELEDSDRVQQLTLLMLAETSRSATNIGILAQELPHPEEYKRKLAEIKHQASSLESDIYLQQDKELFQASDKDISARDRILLVSQDKTRFQKTLSLRSANKALVTEILIKAEDWRAMNARRSKRAWWISSSLFAIGWGLGLLGKVYGLSGVGGSE